MQSMTKLKFLPPTPSLSSFEEGVRIINKDKKPYFYISHHVVCHLPLRALSSRHALMIYPNTVSGLIVIFNG